MSLTIAINDVTVFGNKRIKIGTIAFDSSYPTGGEALTPGNLGLTSIAHINIQPKSGYLFEYDYTNQKVLAYTPVPAGTATLNIKDSDSAGTDGVALYFDEDGTAAARVQFVSPTNTNGTDTCIDIAAAAGAQVANATDLSGVTGVRFMAIGT